MSNHDMLSQDCLKIITKLANIIHSAHLPHVKTEKSCAQDDSKSAKV